MVIGNLKLVRTAQRPSKASERPTCLSSARLSRPLFFAFLMLSALVGASAQVGAGARTYTSNEKPTSLVVVLDATSSMAAKIDEAQKAVAELVRASSPQSEFALVVVRDEPQVAVHLGGSKVEMERAASTVHADGFGTMWDGMYLGLRELQNSRSGRKALVVISDDGDNCGRHTPSELMSLLKKSDVRAYAIGTFDRYANRFQTRMRALQIDEAISPTGGRMIPANDFSYAADQIIQELRHQ